jgi:SAM-dependent methyltransferase
LDARKLTAEAVVARARDLLRSEGLAGDRPAAKGDDAYPDLDGRAAALASARHAVRAPDLSTSRPGVAGQAALFAKRAVRLATYWYIEPRLEAQGRFDDEVINLASDVGAVRSTLEGATSTQANSIQWLTEHTDIALANMAARCDALELEVAELRRELAGSQQGTELATLLPQLHELLQREGSVAPDIDYVAFEDKFRGPSESVKEAQRDYVHLFTDTACIGRVVDIGCGRGEMLTLLIDAGLDAIGVDVDHDMLAVCAEKGLPAEYGTAVDWLRGQRDATLCGIYLGQVVEHLPTNDLVVLVKEAARAIAPGGVFVAETIDPRSLYAVANYFWGDLSHIRPVHPATLAFLLEQAGFASTEVLGRSLHPGTSLGDEVEDDRTRAAIGELARTIYGTQDYAVVAHR